MRPSLSPPTISLLFGVTQTIGYGSLYYAFGVLAPLMSADTGLSLTLVYACLSAALVCSGMVAPVVGRMFDRVDPGCLMAAGSLMSGILLVAWGLVPGKIAFAVVTIAVQMSSVLVLYEAAFVLAARLVPANPRRTITGITLIAGFASTVFWPLTTWLSQFLEWREIVIVYGVANLVLCAPIHLYLADRRPVADKTGAGAAASDRGEQAVPAPGDRDRAFLLLLVAFAGNAYVVSAMHLHLIGLLGALGFAGSAALIGAIIGPAQVAGRIGELVAGHRISVMQVSLLASAALPAALIVLVTGAGWLPAALAFAAIFGMGQGIAYIVRGVLPLVLFGAADYGARTGRINSVRLFVSAAAPFVTAALFEGIGVRTALAATIVVGLVSVGALLAILPILRRGRAVS